MGTYIGAIVVAGSAIQGNYTISYVNGDFTIFGSDAMMISVPNYDGVYDGLSHGSAATTSVAGATIRYSTDGENWSTAVPKRKDVGTTEVTVKATATGYTEKTATYKLNVTPAPVTVATGSATEKYNGRPLVKNEARISGLVNGETATVTATGSQTKVGSSKNTYSIDWGTTNSNNYDIDEYLGTLTVTENDAAITVTIIGNSDELTYNGKDQTVSGYSIVAPEGFIYTEEDLSIRGGAEVKRKDIGTSPMGLTASQFKNTNPGFTNVTFNVTDGKIEITRKDVLVKADKKSKGFGDNDPELTATAEGVVPGDGFRLEYQLTREPGEDVGEYEIKATGNEEQGNYKVSYENGTFTITPKPATTHTVTYKVVNGTWSDDKTAPTEEAVVEGEKPSKIPTGMKPSEGYEGGSWNIDPSTASITGDTTFTYTFTKKQDPPAPDSITYSNTKGDGGTWTKGSTNTLDFTFKRSKDDASTFKHFTGIKVDGETVTEYNAASGSVIIKLKPAFLETLSVGKHTLTAKFDDGTAIAEFTIKAKQGENGGGNANKKSNTNSNTSKPAASSGKTTTTAPKTGDESNMFLWFLLICALLFVMFRIIPLRNRRYYDR